MYLKSAKHHQKPHIDNKSKAFTTWTEGFLCVIYWGLCPIPNFSNSAACTLYKYPQRIIDVISPGKTIRKSAKLSTKTTRWAVMGVGRKTLEWIDGGSPGISGWYFSWSFPPTPKGEGQQRQTCLPPIGESASAWVVKFPWCPHKNQNACM